MFCVTDSPVGALRITAQDGCITGVDRTDLPIVPADDPLLQACVRQLEEYFARQRTVFDLPFRLNGSPFRQRVWAELLRIPYGTVISYGELARRIGQPGASRAVGGANHANPICIIVPCHRVISADGTLGGYGSGLDMKARLLYLEGVTLF